MSDGVARALGLLLGHLADRALADPSKWHPVAGFGQLAAAAERGLYAPTRARGAWFTGLLVGGSTLLGALVERSSSGRPALRIVTTAAATWVVLGGTSLGREAAAVHELLRVEDLPGARQRLTHLVGRDTSVLDEAGVARATIESVAENTSDAVTAPMVMGALFGVPGLLGHRAANTLDAMVGHHTERHEHFGWASARLDDLLNLPGARFGALIAAALAPAVGGEPMAALRSWRADAGRHPSPNAGPIEATFAGALGVQLGGVNTYRDRRTGALRVEDRHTLGDGPAPDRVDIDRARRLAGLVGTGATLLAALAAGLSAAGSKAAGSRAAGFRRPPARPVPRRGR